ncbi:hypothetical protein PN462_20045 [Spirulina sp. CS-785/01]|uniref:XDD3 family exosortase-dependent surface protein n=1 Tax=Spirulina sp. CS-785/01 TaxID=3021716 RepID=UPI0023315161|nr:XDD3 family exosortase-dependent surface protein [Spirulina sp. CS-785/01]MDB9315417.1 hypothetical protein [Spirulina sp. CS-785/01]
MKHFTKTGLSTLLTTLGLLTIPFTTPAFASFFHNDWYYSIDPSYDSIASNGSGGLDVGGSIYEIYGMAIKENVETNTIWVGLNSNLPITGRSVPTYINGMEIPDNNIGWGDMFFDFSGTGNFQQSIDTGQMCGVRFANTNDSGVDSGVYCGMSASSVVSENAGYWNLNAHNNEIVNNVGQNAWMGDKRWNDDYYAPYTGSGYKMPNILTSDNQEEHKVGEGDVTIRSQAELEEEGFETDQFFGEGDNIFGFSFQKPLEMAGDFIATAIQECLNDGMALLGNFTSSNSDSGGDSGGDTGDDNAGDTGDDTGDNIGGNTGDGCAATLSQLEALAPDTVDGEWKIFYDALSHQWYDPPAYSGYTFTTTGGTTFTQIENFPCGISADDSFTVKVGDKDFGPYQPGDSLDFTAFASMGITEFDLIFPWKDPAETDPPFALQLALNDELGSFKMRPIEVVQDVPEPGATVGLLLFGLLGLKLRKKSH